MPPTPTPQPTSTMKPPAPPHDDPRSNRCIQKRLILSLCDKFITVQGGSSYLPGYFAKMNLNLIKKGKEMLKKVVEVKKNTGKDKTNISAQELPVIVSSTCLHFFVLKANVRAMTSLTIKFQRIIIACFGCLSSLCVAFFTGAVVRDGMIRDTY